MIHLLHIGKTGGNVLQAALGPVAEQAGIVFHGHEVRLRDVPPEELAIAAIRHPVGRFVSAFNSRLRGGRPKLNSAWSGAEAIAFARFKTPDALASALAADESETRAAAADAMRSIGHVRQPMSYWLESMAFVHNRDNVIVLVQERLLDHFELLKERLALPRDLVLPTDAIIAHKTPPGFDQKLGSVARANLLEWYAEDVALYGQLAQDFAIDRPLQHAS